MAFDFVNGTGDQETASRLDELAVQAETKPKDTFILDTIIHDTFIQAEANRTALEELEDAVGLGGDDDADVDLDEETIAKLFRLHQEKEKIRHEAENLENPLLRKAERVSKVAQRRNSRIIKDRRAVLVVWRGGNAKKLEDEMMTR